jgi:hypothetical protein
VSYVTVRPNVMPPSTVRAPNPLARSPSSSVPRRRLTTHRGSPLPVRPGISRRGSWLKIARYKAPGYKFSTWLTGWLAHTRFLLRAAPGAAVADLTHGRPNRSSWCMALMSGRPDIQERARLLATFAASARPTPTQTRPCPPLRASASSSRPVSYS